MLKPYLLRKIGANHPCASRNESIKLDEVHQVVVVAESETQARALAQGGDYISGEDDVWTNPSVVECIDLTTIETVGVLVVSSSDG